VENRDMSKKQTAVIVRTEAIPMPDQTDTKPEPVKKVPKLRFLPDPQEIIGDFVDAFVSDEGSDSYDKLVLKDFLSEAYEVFFLGRKVAVAKGRNGAAGVAIPTARGSMIPTTTTSCRRPGWLLRARIRPS
jgi:hypothetical protein